MAANVPTSSRRHALPVVLLTAAALIAAGICAVAWLMASEFASIDMLVLGAIPWSLVPALLVAIAVRLLRPGGARWLPWVALASVWVGIVVLSAVLVLLAA